MIVFYGCWMVNCYFFLVICGGRISKSFFIIVDKRWVINLSLFIWFRKIICSLKITSLIWNTLQIIFISFRNKLIKRWSLMRSSSFRRIFQTISILMWNKLTCFLNRKKLSINYLIFFVIYLRKCCLFIESIFLMDTWFKIRNRTVKLSRIIFTRLISIELFSNSGLWLF